MACEDEKEKMDRLNRDRNEKWEDMIRALLLSGAGGLGTVGSFLLGTAASAGSLGTLSPGAAAVTAGAATVTATQLWAAFDARDDYDDLSLEYFAACAEYRDCMNGN